MSSSTTSSRWRRRWRPSSRACPAATLIPHVHPGVAPGIAALRARRAARRARAAGRAAVAALRAPRRARSAPGPRRAQRDARAASGCAPLRRLHGGISERLCLVGTFPQLEYPRAGRSTCTSSGRCSGSRRPSCRAAAGRGAARARRPSTAQDPEHRLLRAARDRARRRAACGCSRPRTAGRCAGRWRSRRTRGWSTGCPTRRRCRGCAVVDLPRRPRHAGAGARLGRARASPCPTPATWPRTPRGPTGPASASGCRGALLSPATLRLAVRRALADSAARRSALASSRPGRQSTTAPRALPSWSRRWRA